MKAFPHEVNMATRRHILDASYRLHMKKAIQLMLKPEQHAQCTIEVVADIRKAFETVDRQLHYAKVYEYPLDLLYLFL